MQRIFSAVVVVVLTAGLLGCSGSGGVTQKTQPSSQTNKIQQYPSWYGDRSVVNTDSVMYGYATAISGDSASAVSKARSWAETEIKSTLSNKLENIRSSAAAEYGSEYGLDDTRFLIALRKVDNAVSHLAKNGHAEVRTVEGYDSYRSFAEVMVPKDELVERIGKRLAGYEKAWNAMKESDAFTDF